MCANHHKIVDDNPKQYTVEDLQRMKAAHEDRVRRALEDKSEFDVLSYEAIVVYIEMMMDFDKWDVWTSYLLSADGPMLSCEMQESINEIKQYILSRIWPKQYPDIEKAIQEFRKILIDLDKVFHRHSEKKDGWYITEKFYKIRQYDYRIADELNLKYRKHLCLVANLTYEMTRSANRICNLTRKYINPTYRQAEGALLSYEERPEYREGEYYPGLEEFERICKTRDVHV